MADRMTERIDLGELSIVTNGDIEPGQVWLGRADAPGPSKRLIEAFARGEVTAGGMAEAGWQVIGKVADGGGFKLGNPCREPGTLT